MKFHLKSFCTPRELLLSSMKLTLTVMALTALLSVHITQCSSFVPLRVISLATVVSFVISLFSFKSNKLINMRHWCRTSFNYIHIQPEIVSFYIFFLNFVIV